MRGCFLEPFTSGLRLKLKPHPLLGHGLCIRLLESPLCSAAPSNSPVVCWVRHGFDPKKDLVPFLCSRKWSKGARTWLHSCFLRIACNCLRMLRRTSARTRWPRVGTAPCGAGRSLRRARFRWARWTPLGWCPFFGFALPWTTACFWGNITFYLGAI